ncbi:MAG: cytidylate kinase [Spirochaetes bacterium]|nr:MAG: cytidylate kinase [Spirochaetota bacterium]
MSNSYRIAISGKSGCGNSSVSRIVSERLNLRLINYTFHDIARERGVAFEEICMLAEKDPQYDLKLDKRQVQMASGGNCVLGSRLAIWLLEDADLKVYLDAPVEVRALRIAKREKTPYEETLKKTINRDRRDRERYLKLYGIDIDDFNFADLIINTEEGDQFFVAERIIDSLPLHSG